MIRVDAWWLSVQPLDMRVGTEAALARVVQVFGQAHPHHAYLFANRRANRMKVLVHDGTPAPPGGLGSLCRVYCEDKLASHEGDVQMKFSDIRRIWRDSVRMFFAPLVGAIHGAIQQSRAVHKDVLKHRH